jgi:co-chaperonin GroES (HSP10)
LKASVKVGKTITAKTVAVGGKLAVASTAKVTLTVKSGDTVCKVVGATLKGLKKGTCKVLASVKTGTKTKTATVTVTVS